MPKITIEKASNIHIRCFSEPSVEAELSDYFTYAVPGAQFTPQYRSRLWDGKIRQYDRVRHTLYLGLYRYVEKFAVERGYEIECKDLIVVDRKIPFEEVENWVDSLQLASKGRELAVREYQVEAIHKALNDERTLLVSPTASGKSLIIYSTLRYLINQGKKAIIIVPTTSLVEQLYKDFEDYSSINGWNVPDHVQKLYSGFTKDIDKQVLITTWQSVYKQPRQWFAQFDVCFGDEAHQFKARSLTTCMDKLINCNYRIGTTGTIDGKKVHKLVLEGVFGPVFAVTTTKKLMEDKKVAELDITCLLLKYDELTRQGRKTNKYADEMDFLVTNDARNKFIVNLAADLKGNTLVLYQFVQKHGIPLYEDLNKKVDGSKDIWFVSGDTVVKDREKVREIAGDTDNNIIVASFGTFSTGINIPSIENIIFASPSKSKIRNLQSIGRGLRLKEGKESCNLYDVADDLSWKSWKNHTLKHFSERLSIYSEEKFNYKIVEVNING